MATLEITELLGDGIGPELEGAVHRIADALSLDVTFRPVDLSLENRETVGRALYDEAVTEMERTKLALKYPTVTKAESPNAVLRRRCRFSVIYRPAISIPGVTSNFSRDVNLHVIRVATGGTYEDPGRIIGDDAAVSLRIVERKPCRDAARFAFALARRRGLSVTSTSKHTIQRYTDGFFESVVQRVHDEFPDVAHHVELFDALLGKVILQPDAYEVVLCLNEYGDFLSDMAGGLVGSLGMGASASYGFTDDGAPDIAMFDPAGGTAPDIAGQDRANPTAALLAFAMLLDHVDRPDLGAALHDALKECLAEGRRTADLGGSLGTRAFTEEVAGALVKRL